MSKRPEATPPPPAAPSRSRTVSATPQAHPSPPRTPHAPASCAGTRRGHHARMHKTVTCGAVSYHAVRTLTARLAPNERIFGRTATPTARSRRFSFSRFAVPAASIAAHIVPPQNITVPRMHWASQGGGSPHNTNCCSKTSKTPAVRTSARGDASTPIPRIPVPDGRKVRLQDTSEERAFL